MFIELTTLNKEKIFINSNQIISLYRGQKNMISTDTNKVQVIQRTYVSTNVRVFEVSETPGEIIGKIVVFAKPFE